jgi:hypothetical protein
MPPNALQALNAAEEHLASQAGIPDILRPALMQAEANFRGNAGNVMPIASIDPGRLLVNVPDGCEKQALFAFLWNALMRSGKRSIQFAFAAEDDTLQVIYMDRDCVGYMASAPVRTANGKVQLGDWTVKAIPRSDEQ